MSFHDWWIFGSTIAGWETGKWLVRRRPFLRDPHRATVDQIKQAAPKNPWIPLDPDGLPPETYPFWRRSEQEKRA